MSNKTASAIASAAATAASIHLMVNESVVIVKNKKFLKNSEDMRKIKHIKSNNFNNVEAGNLPPLVSRLVAVILFQAAKLRK